MKVQVDKAEIMARLIAQMIEEDQLPEAYSMVSASLLTLVECTDPESTGGHSINELIDMFAETAKRTYKMCEDEL